MMKIKGYEKQTRCYQGTYISEVRTFNISSDDMDDDCKPRMESTGCITWTDDKMSLCELETIYPEEVTWDQGIRNAPLATVTGLPVLEIKEEEKGVWLFQEGTDAILFLKEKVNPDKKCEVGQVVYYISGDEVVAIECKNTVSI